jgi:hypothetical protein
MKPKFKLHDQYIEYEPGSPVSITLKGDDKPVDIVLTEEQLEKLVEKKVLDKTTIMRQCLSYILINTIERMDNLKNALYTVYMIEPLLLEAIFLHVIKEIDTNSEDTNLERVQIDQSKQCVDDFIKFINE